MTQPQEIWTFALVVLLLSAAFFAHAEVVLFDGETDADVAAWSALKRVNGNEAPFLPILGTDSATAQRTTRSDRKADRFWWRKP